MDPGRRIAAQAVEARRGELGLKQDEFAIDPTTYRDFIRGEHWPTARTRAKIEVKLGWDVGTIADLAHRANLGNSAASLAQATDDPDEVAMLTSELPDPVKRRLIARLWAAKTRRPRDEGETGTSQIL